MTEEVSVPEVSVPEPIEPELIEPTENERLQAEASAFMREATEQRVRAVDAEMQLAEQTTRACVAEAKLTALLIELSREEKGSVFDINFKLDGAMYARETIHQRVQSAIKRAQIA